MWRLANRRAYLEAAAGSEMTVRLPTLLELAREPSPPSPLTHSSLFITPPLHTGKPRSKAPSSVASHISELLLIYCIAAWRSLFCTRSHVAGAFDDGEDRSALTAADHTGGLAGAAQAVKKFFDVSPNPVAGFEFARLFWSFSA